MKFNLIHFLSLAVYALKLILSQEVTCKIRWTKNIPGFSVQILCFITIKKIQFFSIINQRFFRLRSPLIIFYSFLVSCERKNKNFRNTQNRTNHENKQRMNEWNFNSEKFWTALCLRLCETTTPTQQYHRREFPERRREESLRDRLFALLAFFANLPNIFGLFLTARITI